MKFCESRDQILLPLLIDFPASQSVLTEVSEQIGYLNYEHPEVEFWIPYKQEKGKQNFLFKVIPNFKLKIGIWQLQMNGQKHCPKSVFTSKCSLNDIGNCGTFSYDPYDSTCNGVRNKPCAISEKSRKSEIKKHEFDTSQY